MRFSGHSSDKAPKEVEPKRQGRFKNALRKALCIPRTHKDDHAPILTPALITAPTPLRPTVIINKPTFTTPPTLPLPVITSTPLLPLPQALTTPSTTSSSTPSSASTSTTTFPTPSPSQTTTLSQTITATATPVHSIEPSTWRRQLYALTKKLHRTETQLARAQDAEAHERRERVAAEEACEALRVLREQEQTKQTGLLEAAVERADVAEAKVEEQAVLLSELELNKMIARLEQERKEEGERADIALKAMREVLESARVWKARAVGAEGNVAAVGAIEVEVCACNNRSESGCAIEEDGEVEVIKQMEVAEGIMIEREVEGETKKSEKGEEVAADVAQRTTRYEVIASDNEPTQKVEQIEKVSAQETEQGEEDVAVECEVKDEGAMEESSCPMVHQGQSKTSFEDTTKTDGTKVAQAKEANESISLTASRPSTRVIEKGAFDQGGAPLFSGEASDEEHDEAKTAVKIKGLRPLLLGSRRKGAEEGVGEEGVKEVGAVAPEELTEAYKRQQEKRMSRVPRERLWSCGEGVVAESEHMGTVEKIAAPADKLVKDRDTAVKVMNIDTLQSCWLRQLVERLQAEIEMLEEREQAREDASLQETLQLFENTCQLRTQHGKQFEQLQASLKKARFTYALLWDGGVKWGGRQEERRGKPAGPRGICPSASTSDLSWACGFAPPTLAGLRQPLKPIPALSPEFSTLFSPLHLPPLPPSPASTTPDTPPKHRFRPVGKPKEKVKPETPPTPPWFRVVRSMDGCRITVNRAMQRVRFLANTETCKMGGRVPYIPDGYHRRDRQIFEEEDPKHGDERMEAKKMLELCWEALEGYELLKESTLRKVAIFQIAVEKAEKELWAEEERAGGAGTGAGTGVGTGAAGAKEGEVGDLPPALAALERSLAAKQAEHDADLTGLRGALKSVKRANGGHRSPASPPAGKNVSTPWRLALKPRVLFPEEPTPALTSGGFAAGATHSQWGQRLVTKRPHLPPTPLSASPVINTPGKHHLSRLRSTGKLPGAKGVTGPTPTSSTLASTSRPFTTLRSTAHLSARATADGSPTQKPSVAALRNGLRPAGTRASTSSLRVPEGAPKALEEKGGELVAKLVARRKVVDGKKLVGGLANVAVKSAEPLKKRVEEGGVKGEDAKAEVDVVQPQELSDNIKIHTTKAGAVGEGEKKDVQPEGVAQVQEVGVDDGGKVTLDGHEEDLKNNNNTVAGAGAGAEDECTGDMRGVEAPGKKVQAMSGEDEISDSAVVLVVLKAHGENNSHITATGAGGGDGEKRGEAAVIAEGPQAPYSHSTTSKTEGGLVVEVEGKEDGELTTEPVIELKMGDGERPLKV
ncbi:hypothetical protein IAT38_000427 [Cryptococcus sp. DSM 104549]